MSTWRSETERPRMNPVLVGALVMLGAVVLFYIAANRELPFSGGYEAKIQFQTANQISPNAPVRVAGVNVGEVGSIERGDNDTALVTVEIDDKGLPLHTDAQARVRPRTFLEGAFFVDIHPGSPSAPELPDGGTIPLGQTSTPVQVDQILSALTPPVRGRLRSAVQELATALDGEGPKAINATIPTLDPLFTQGARVAEAFAGTEPGDLGRAVRSSSRVASILARKRPELGELVGDFSTVSRALADRQRELAGTIRGLDGLVAEAPPALDALSDATPELRSLVGELDPVLRRAPGVVNNAVPLTAELQALLRSQQLPEFVELARPTVRDLTGAAPGTIEVFGGLRAPVRCVLTSAVPTLKSTIEDGDLSSGEPVYRELLYSLTGLASASQNYDGNGFSTRYYAGFGSELVSTPLGDLGGRLFGLVDEPIVGSRPEKPSSAPPLRPQAPCAQSAPPNLDAATGPGGFSEVGQELDLVDLDPKGKAGAGLEKAIDELAEGAP